MPDDRPPTPPHDDPRTDDDPMSDTVRSSVLEDEEGDEYVVDQQNAGPSNTKGGDEFPSPSTPPEAPAPGAD